MLLFFLQLKKWDLATFCGIRCTRGHVGCPRRFGGNIRGKISGRRIAFRRSEAIWTDYRRALATVSKSHTLGAHTHGTVWRITCSHLSPSKGNAHNWRHSCRTRRNAVDHVHVLECGFGGALDECSCSRWLLFWRLDFFVLGEGLVGFEYSFPGSFFNRGLRGLATGFPAFLRRRFLTTNRVRS